MSLQFADFNADGHKDIVTATWEGTPFLVAGGPDGWQEPKHITDAGGKKMYLSRYYDFDGNKYDNWEYGAGDETKNGDHLISTLAWDFDADGDYDLLFGAKDGQLYLRENQGDAKTPKFASINKKVKAGEGYFSVPGGMTAADKVDWDGDGADDLICGSFDGAVWFYRNTNKTGAPVFAKGVKLLGAKKGAGPETGWYVDATDYDNDGDLDLLVGGYFMPKMQKRVLNAEEKARLAELDKTIRAMSKKLGSLYAPVMNDQSLSNEERSKALREIMKTDEYTSVQKKMNELRKEQMKLRPVARRTSGVWVYRQKSAEGAAPGNGGEKVVRR